MIADILFISRVITGKLTLELGTVDIADVVRSAIDTVLPSVEAKEIRLQSSFDPALIQVEGDEKRLRQILWNLLSNAVKFTPPRGRIDVSVRLAAGSVVVEVSDTGQGIEPEFLPYVFERFRQADSSYTRQAGGLGLGLAIVRYLAELHGGRVSAESAGEGLGAHFTVSLPVAAARNPSPPAETISEAPPEESEDGAPLGGVRVVLVEDDADSREMLRVFLEQNEMRVTAVDSAAGALAAVEETRPDILISDVGLPGEDGYRLIGRVRALPPEKGGATPAIALTGYASPQDRDRALRAGFQAHLAKPVEIDEMLDLIKKVLASDQLV